MGCLCAASAGPGLCHRRAPWTVLQVAPRAQELATLLAAPWERAKTRRSSGSRASLHSRVRVCPASCYTLEYIYRVQCGARCVLKICVLKQRTLTSITEGSQTQTDHRRQELIVFRDDRIKDQTSKRIQSVRRTSPRPRVHSSRPARKCHESRESPRSLRRRARSAGTILLRGLHKQEA